MLKAGAGLCGVIRRAAGEKPFEEAVKGVSLPVPAGSVIATSAGKLQVAYILHAVGPDCREMSLSQAEPLLQKTFENILQRAEALQLESVAMAGISTGIYQFPLEAAAKVMVNSLQKVAAGTSHRYPLEVHIYPFAKEWRQALVRQLQRTKGPLQSRRKRKYLNQPDQGKAKKRRKL
jgi:O-acetyl-ADP-ribose deacetylase (regulator of RNase III)